MNYTEIKTMNEWKSYHEASADKPLIIFKHSTTCPVSSNAYEEFSNYLKDKPREDVEYVLVKVIESRPISLQIAEDTGVKHESPQIIYLEKQEKYWTSSHWSITKAHISAVLD